jgi:hypothetical protein
VRKSSKARVPRNSVADFIENERALHGTRPRNGCRHHSGCIGLRPSEIKPMGKFEHDKTAEDAQPTQIRLREYVTVEKDLAATDSFVILAR